MEATPEEIVCTVNTYAINIKLTGNKLTVRAFSESLVNLFNGEFSKSDFPEEIQAFGDCEAIINLIEESTNQKQEVTLSDTGELIFPFQIKLGKLKYNKQIVLKLKEVQFDDIQKLNLKIQKQQKQLKRQQDELKKQGDSLQRYQNDIQTLRQQNARLGQQMKLIRPKIQKTLFEIDTTSSYYNRFQVKDRTVSLNIGNSNNYYPLFSSKQIQNIQRFQFDILNQGVNSHSIGIASAELKHSTAIYNNATSICLYSNSNAYICGTARKILIDPILRTGSKVAMIVDLKNFTIEWQAQQPLVFSTPKVVIPVQLRNKLLYPFVEVYDNSNSQIQIRFL